MGITAGQRALGTGRRVSSLRVTQAASETAGPGAPCRALAAGGRGGCVGSCWGQCSALRDREMLLRGQAGSRAHLGPRAPCPVPGPPGPLHPTPRRPPRCCRSSRPTLTLGSATVSPRAPGARPWGCGVVLASPSLLLPRRRGSLSAVTSQADGHDRCSRDAPPGHGEPCRPRRGWPFSPVVPALGSGRTGVEYVRGGPKPQ